MKKQKLLILLSTITLSLSLILTPLSASANTLESNQNNIILAKSTSEPLIVLKGKNITCGSKLDRLLALEYLNEDKTRPDFDDISIDVRINDKTAELIPGAQIDLTEHNGEMIAIDYKYKDKVVKTLKLKVDCVEETKAVLEFTEEVEDGILRIDAIDFLTFDPLKYVNAEELGGKENIEFKIWNIVLDKEVTLSSIPISLDPVPYRITYNLKSDPNVTKVLILQQSQLIYPS